MAIPETIKKLANDIRTKIYGKEVREALAQGIEEAGNIADQANQTSNVAVEQVRNIQAQVDQLVVEGDSSVEAAQARVDVNGNAYTTLKERLDTEYQEHADKIGILNKKTDGIFNVKEFGVKGDGTTDDTTAIQAAIDSVPPNGVIFFPRGTYKITSALKLKNRRLIGSGVSSTFIIQYTDSEAVIKVNGQATYVSDITLKHNVIPSSQTVPNGVGIQCEQVSDLSVIERVHIENVTSGIYSKEPWQSGTTDNYIYSSSIRDIRISRFTHSGIYISYMNAGNTGIVLENIYIINWDTYPTTKFQAKYGIFVKSFDELIANQINIEHGKYEYGIYIDYCGVTQWNSIHFEGYEQVGSYNSMFNIQGAETKQVQINSCSIVYCTFDTVPSAICKFDYSPNIKINGLHIKGNSRINNASVRLFYADPNVTQNALLEVEGFSDAEGLVNTADYYGSITFQFPILYRKNRNQNMIELGGRRIINGSAPPTTGTWSIGDIVYSTNPSATGYIGWVCTVTGTPGTWKSFGALGV
ncbi:glycosyl hydrolase family 28-related protein [Aeribacillus pallidus]|nr:glycosyl hydrolase family 28-related protein [Aeribacillus pallidus]